MKKSLLTKVLAGFSAAVMPMAMCMMLLASCDKPDNPENNGGNGGNGNDPANPTLTASMVLSEGAQTEFALNYIDRDGLEGNVSFSFTVQLSEVTLVPVIVALSAECEGVSSVTCPAQVSVPAGSSTSSVVTVRVTDWSEVVEVEEEASYTFTVSMGEITSDANVRAGEPSSLSATVTKPARPEIDESQFTDIDFSQYDFSSDFYTVRYTNSYNYFIGEGYTENTTATDWDFELWSTNGTELEYNPDACGLLGTAKYWDNGADIAVQDDLINYIVDFNEVKTLGGLKFSFYGTTYMPGEIKVSLSNAPLRAGEWVEMMTCSLAAPGNSSCWISFDSFDVQTRYMKVEMTETSTTGRLSITGMYIYEK